MMKKIFTLIFISSFLISCKCTKTDAVSKLDGTWELNYIADSQTFDALYPNKKPSIVFKTAENQVSGNNGCNSYTGKLNVTGNKIDLTQPMAVTKMMCLDGQQGEQTYMSTLQKITSYDITDDGKTLNFISGDIAMMRFTKK